MLNNLNIAEYRLLVLLLKNCDEPRDMTNFYGYNISSKGIKVEHLSLLMKKGFLSMYEYDYDKKIISYDFSYWVKQSSLFKVKQSIDINIATKLRTKSGTQLYEYILSHGEIVDDEIVATLTVDELKSVFNCFELTYEYYKDLRVRKLDPAIKDLNKAGYEVSYDVVKNGTRVESIRLYKKVPKKVVYKDLNIDKDFRIQEAIGRICEVLFLYSIKLSISPKDYEEYLLDYTGSMFVANSPKDSSIRVRVFRSDTHIDKYPLIINAIVKDDTVSYKISYKSQDGIEYDWIIKDEYDVLIALENIKYAILQGEDLSAVIINNENALHVHLSERVKHLEHKWVSSFEISNIYKLVINIMDKFNEHHKTAFKYAFKLQCEPEKHEVTNITISYKNSTWIAALNDDYIHLNKVLEEDTEDIQDYTVYDLMDFFNVICNKYIEKELYEIIEANLKEFTE